MCCTSSVSEVATINVHAASVVNALAEPETLAVLALPLTASCALLNAEVVNMYNFKDQQTLRLYLKLKIIAQRCYHAEFQR